MQYKDTRISHPEWKSAIPIEISFILLVSLACYASKRTAEISGDARSMPGLRMRAVLIVHSLKAETAQNWQFWAFQ